jgi:hypothetical protein
MSSGKIRGRMWCPKDRSPLGWPISLHLFSVSKGLSLWKATNNPRPTRVQVTKARGNPRPEPGRHQGKVGVLGLLRGSGRPGVPPLGLAQRHLAPRLPVLTSCLGSIILDGGASSGSRSASLGSSFGTSSLGMSSGSRVTSLGSKALGGSTAAGICSLSGERVACLFSSTIPIVSLQGLMRGAILCRRGEWCFLWRPLASLIHFRRRCPLTSCLIRGCVGVCLGFRAVKSGTGLR